MPYPDDTSNIDYLDRPCRTEDQYAVERYERLKVWAAKLFRLREQFIADVQCVMTEAYNRDVKKVGEVMRDYRDLLDDAEGNTIRADLADAKDRMEGN